MSRTYRKVPEVSLRKMHTKNELTQLLSLKKDILNEEEWLEYRNVFGKRNRLNKYIANPWDDFVASSVYQMDFSSK